jgi:hypothetical protein
MRWRPPRLSRVSAEHRRALRLLASSRRGVNAALLVHGNGFKRRVLARLGQAWLAAAKREVIRPSGGTE